MRHTRMAALTLSLVTLLTTLCGCHGSRSQNAFTVPDSFDESRQYEITFWAKNDTNKTQVDIYQQGHRRLPGAVPQHHREAAALH